MMRVCLESAKAAWVVTGKDGPLDMAYPGITPEALPWDILPSHIREVELFIVEEKIPIATEALLHLLETLGQQPLPKRVAEKMTAIREKLRDLEPVTTRVWQGLTGAEWDVLPWRHLPSILTMYGLLRDHVTAYGIKREKWGFLEKPETGLHPSSQMERMATLIGRMEENENINIVIETHSEHILNAIRIAVHERQLKPEDVAINWITTGTTGLIVNPKVDADGRLDEWPDGSYLQLPFI